MQHTVEARMQHTVEARVSLQTRRDRLRKGARRAPRRGQKLCQQVVDVAEYAHLRRARGVGCSLACLQPCV